MAATLMCSVFQQAFTKLESPATTFYKLTVIDQVGIMAQQAISLQPLPSDVISALCVLASFAGLPGFWWYLDGWPGEHYQFHESTLTFPIDKALRVAEALSHMRIHDAVFGVGEGLPLVDTWKRQVASWHHEQIYFVDTSIPREAVKIDVEQLWQALRSWSPNYYHTPFTLE
jgi:hypothetical protein